LSQCSSDEKQVIEVKALLEGKDFYGLCHYSLSHEGLTVKDYRNLRQVLAFFSKRKDLKIGVDTKAVAWKKAIEAEALCRETNAIFRTYFQGGFSFPLDVESVLHRAQWKISEILGDLPELSELELRFGPGATTQVKKKDASARRKLAQVFSCSEEATAHVSELLAEMPNWSGVKSKTDSPSVARQIDIGRVDFVRKTAKEDRTIQVEPSLNTMVQLGIGTYMASRLKVHGVDIADQTLNQRLACEGSLTGELATLDLSSASDTIARLFCMSMLPWDWFAFLDSIRTGRASSPDGVIRLEKFSSMGNGFTFPLETLIFYAIAISCCTRDERSKVNAYGDDIIVPVSAVPLLMKTLHCCGFIVNKSKSFFSGNFRESCGKDYLSGIDVRPCYVKDALSGAKCFVLYNYYIRTSQPEPAALLLEYVDESLRIFGPDGYGDGHLLGDFTRTPLNRELGWGGFTFETFTRRARKAFYRLGADHVFPSYCTYVKGGPEMGFIDKDPPLTRFLRIDSFYKLRRRSFGLIRPERSDSQYVQKNGKWFLSDTLPGYQGYDRIKIYTFS